MTKSWRNSECYIVNSICSTLERFYRINKPKRKRERERE
jgi:hypothetical protein